MGIAPNIWGPSTWAFIHLAVLAEKEPLDTTRLPYYKQFFETLTQLLPCTTCRNHLLENLSKLPAITTLKTKRELFDWTTQLHNLVNTITYKQTWDLEQAYQHWKDISEGKKQLTGNNHAPMPNYWKYISITLLIVLLLSMYWSRQHRKK